METLPNTIGGRIAYYRHKLGWSQGELVYRCGWCKKSETTARQGRISHYEKNFRTPTPNDLVILARVLGTTPDVLTFGRKASKVDPINLIRVLTITQLKKTKGNSSKLDEDDVTEYHAAPLDSVAGKRIYALRVSTATMQPEFRPDDIIVLDADLTPEPDDYVMVSFGRDDPVLRQYVKEGRKSLYCALDKRIPVDTRKPRIYGVVISKSTSYHK